MILALLSALVGTTADTSNLRNFEGVSCGNDWRAELVTLWEEEEEEEAEEEEEEEDEEEEEEEEEECDRGM